jgi:hypothetical protein
MVTAPRNDFLGGGRGARPQYDERHADLAEPFVGNADDGRCGDVGMTEQQVLDLGRIGVEAAHDEHVLRPADDAQQAIGVEDAEVTGAQPTIFGQDSSGGLRLVEVVRHHARSAQRDLPRLADRQVRAGCVDDPDLEARPGAANRRRDDLGWIVGAGPGCGPGLGEPVAGHDRRER